MSINHFSSDLPETLWWAQPHPHGSMEPPSSSKLDAAPATSFWAAKPISGAQNSAFSFDLNNEDDEEIIDDDRESQNHSFLIKKSAEQQQEESREVPKEPLFEKPLTPSDVGKLNRLVIPKQHAEKYFPLAGGGGGNESGEKGMLLSFEDESGKPWRFRYSYWNSSQSYVLTKGWSRFVKEKRLDAGDIVLFERHRFDGDRLFIGWRRRRSAAAAAAAGEESSGVGQAAATVVGGGGGGWTRMYFPSGQPYPAQQQQQQQHHGPALPYQPDCLHAAAAASVLQNQTTATSTSANSKRLRLFGVNLECQQQPDEFYSEPSEPPTPPEGSSNWGQGQAQGSYQFQYYPKVVHHPYFNHHNHMDINFSRDVNQTRYPQG